MNFYSYDDSNDGDDVSSPPLQDEELQQSQFAIEPLIIDGRYICECGKSYKAERYMRHHQRWECGKLPSFQCPYCKYKAKRKNSLKSHLQRRHMEYDNNFVQNHMFTY